MEAAVVELDELCTARTPRPAFGLAKIEDVLGALVVSTGMRPAVVPATTPGARAYRAPWCGAVVDGWTAAEQGSLRDRAEEATASGLVTVYAVESAEFTCFVFESGDEVAREMGLGLGKRNVFAAAAGRVEALVAGSRFKEVGETSDVVVMATRGTDFGSIDGVLADDADVTCCSSERR